MPLLVSGRAMVERQVLPAVSKAIDASIRSNETELLSILTNIRATLQSFLATQVGSSPLPVSSGRETKGQLRVVVEEHYPDHAPAVIDAITNDVWAKGMSATQYRAKYMHSTKPANIDNSNLVADTSHPPTQQAPTNPTTNSQPQQPPAELEEEYDLDQSDMTEEDVAHMNEWMAKYREENP